MHLAARSASVVGLALVLVAARAAAGADPEVFPGAVADPRETGALSSAAGPVVVFRTGESFGVVLNYYRFKRKQAVHVIEEDVAARFQRIADVLEHRADAAALASDPMVRRFHLHRFGRVGVPPAAAARAWREHARRFAGRVQRIGEGERVTIYRPYLSQRTFELIDQTVIVLRKHGGPAHDRPTPTDRRARSVPVGARGAGSGRDR